MRLLLSILTLIAVLAACDRNAPPEVAPGTLDPVVFADVMGELAVARIEALPDSASYRQRRAEILRSAGVTEEDLRRFAAVRGSDPDLVRDVYERIGARVDSHAQR